MKFSKLLSGLLAAAMLPFQAVPVNAEEKQEHIESVNGTFIQPWLYAAYSDEQWEGEMQAMKEIGIEYLIMGDVANQLADDSWTVYYPSELDFLEGYYAYNAIDKLMYYCDKYEIKVYLGMGLDCAWNSDIASAEGRAANAEYMERCNQITTELYNMYKPLYPDTYYGFYFVTELYNTLYMDTDTGINAYADALDEMFTMVIDNCTDLDPDMPLLFSPYINIFGYGYASINVDRFTEYYTEVLSRIPFRDGDMLCPQDSCGGGGCDPEHLEKWTAAYRNAVDRSNAARGTELLLGTNAEMFVSPDASRMNSPHGVSYVGTKTVDDFVKRLEIASPYVDSLFCFAYPHHYSPFNAMPEFHENFVGYLKTGEIETQCPTPPDVVKTQTVIAEDAEHLQLSLYGMADNTAVAQTNIYKNGRLYDYLVAGVSIGGNGSNTTQNVWIDYEFDIKNETAVYEFECIDVCGNVSVKSSYTVSPDNVNNGASEDSAENTSPAAEWDFTDIDHLEYTVSGNSIRITGFDNTIEHLVIPDTIGGLPVTVIDWYAFANCTNLVSVTLPDTITHISRFAFVHCINLETINMPASLYAIEQYAFHDCPKLNGISLPENLVIIETRAFSGCSTITELTIPASCTQVGDYSFLDCDALRYVRIESETVTLGERSLGYVYDNGYRIKSGFLIDSDCGTGVQYATDNGIILKGEMIRGDVNADGEFTAADVVMLQKWLLGAGDIFNWQAGDLCEDGSLDVFDLCIMKRELFYGTEKNYVDVSTVEELFIAMRNAQPGDVIRAAGGIYDYSTYQGAQKIDTSAEGTESAPITLTAADPENPPVLTGTSCENGYVIHITGDYWILENLCITTSQKGIVLDNSNHSVIRNCEVYNIGSEAIAIRDGSSYCTVKDSYIHDTGTVTPGYGEGVYIGSAKSVTGFDYKCDYNTVDGCTFRDVAAEHVDVKEYTTGTEIMNCTFYGDGMTGANYAGSFIDIAGNDVNVHNNVGYRNGNANIVAAFELHEQVEGWGYHCVFTDNTLYMDQPYGAVDTSRRMYVADGWYSDFSVKNNLVDYGEGLVPADSWEYYNSDHVTYLES